MINLYVCKICGEPYLGGSAPDDCPFCGAPKHFLGLAEDYKTLWGCTITPTEKRDLEAALKGEVNATYYYDKVAKREKKYSKYNRLYKQFTRVEQEHISTIVKFLGIEPPALTGEEPRKTMAEDLARTQELESGAVKDYAQFAKEATNTGVKLLFTALLHAESGHLEMAKKG